jgi:hypothetical protein
MVQALPKKLTFMEFLESYPEQGRYELMILLANSAVGLIVRSHTWRARDTRPYQSAGMIGFSGYSY